MYVSDLQPKIYKQWCYKTTDIKHGRQLSLYRMTNRMRESKSVKFKLLTICLETTHKVHSKIVAMLLLKLEKSRENFENVELPDSMWISYTSEFPGHLMKCSSGDHVCL